MRTSRSARGATRRRTFGGAGPGDRDQSGSDYGPAASGVERYPIADCVGRRTSRPRASLPDALKDFVDEQVKRGYGTSSEYVRELIRKDQERLRLREFLLAGAASAPAARADSGYFKRLRSRVRRARASGARR
jgi:antitoxin ParD1/3/4